MRRPKVSEVTWDYFYSNSGGNYFAPLDFSYRVMISREHGVEYFKLIYLKNRVDAHKYFYGETAWMDITRYIHDLGDTHFNIDDIVRDMVNYAAGSLKGTC